MRFYGYSQVELEIGAEDFIDPATAERFSKPMILKTRVAVTSDGGILEDSIYLNGIDITNEPILSPTCEEILAEKGVEEMDIDL